MPSPLSKSRGECRRLRLLGAGSATGEMRREPTERNADDLGNSSRASERRPGEPPPHGQVARAFPAHAEGGARRNETPHERLDRNLQELLSELRVVVTGIQVLFAFLLVVPFNAGFVHIGAFERRVYFVTLLLAAMAGACMLAPAAHHRLLFRSDDKAHIVAVSNRLMVTGLAFLALAMCGSLLLVATKLFGVATGAITVGVAASGFAVLWFVLPLIRNAGRNPAAAASAGGWAPELPDAPSRGERAPEHPGAARVPGV